MTDDPTPAMVVLTIRTGVADKEVVGYVYPDAPGLAIHKGADDAYTVSHARSGLRVMGGLLPIEKAHAAAVDLAREADWTRSGGELRADAERLKPIRNAIASRHQARIAGVDPKSGAQGRAAEGAPDLDQNLKALADLRERKERG
jgi:hypothetical protein